MHKNDKTHVKLIEAGIKLFGQNDFSNVSTRDLTKAAGACLGGLFYHFGSKEKLYTEVVTVLISEAEAKFSGFHSNDFQNLNLDEMKKHISKMISSLNDSFMSEHSISFSNIFNREVLTNHNSDVTLMLQRFANNIQDDLNKTLIIYYTKSELPVSNVEFVIVMIFSILKNRLAHDDRFYKSNAHKSNVIQQLTDLVLHQRLI